MTDRCLTTLNGLEKERFSLYPRDMAMESCFVGYHISPFTPKPQILEPATRTWEECLKRRPGCKSTHCTCNMPIERARLYVMSGYGISFIDIRDLPETLPKEQQRQQQPEHQKQHQQSSRAEKFATEKDFGVAQRQPKQKRSYDWKKKK